MKYESYWSDEDIKFILESYPDLDTGQISRLITFKKPYLRRSNLVYFFLKERGLLVRTSDVDHSFFKEIDDEFKSYIYGFIIGDGCIYRYRESGFVKIGISFGDKQLLEDMKLIMKSRYPIKRDRDIATLVIKSDEMYKDLLRYGLVPRKSYHDFSGCFVPKESLFCHFLRGLIDSDGSVLVKNKNTFYGDVRFMQGKHNRKFVAVIKDLVKEMIGLEGFYYDDLKAGRLSYSGNEAVKMIRFLYERSHLSLSRKRENAILIYNNYKDLCAHNEL